MFFPKKQLALEKLKHSLKNKGLNIYGIRAVPDDDNEESYDGGQSNQTHSRGG